jgi:hypothetical protein
MTARRSPRQFHVYGLESLTDEQRMAICMRAMPQWLALLEASYERHPIVAPALVPVDSDDPRARLAVGNRLPGLPDTEVA